MGQDTITGGGWIDIYLPRVGMWLAGHRIRYLVNVSLLLVNDKPHIETKVSLKKKP